MNYKKNKVSNAGLEKIAAVLAEKIKKGEYTNEFDPNIENDLKVMRLSPGDRTIVRYLISDYL